MADIIEGYIIETETCRPNGHSSWDKFNRKVYKDLEAAIGAWTNYPSCCKDWVFREAGEELLRFNVNCRIIPVYRGRPVCCLDKENNRIDDKYNPREG